MKLYIFIYKIKTIRLYLIMYVVICIYTIYICIKIKLIIFKNYNLLQYYNIFFSINLYIYLRIKILNFYFIF